MELDINSIKDSLENIVNYAITHPEPDKILGDAYIGTRESLKQLKGTGANITGLAEFLYVRYIFKSFEKHFKKKLNIISSGKIRYFELEFKNCKIMLSSDIDIQKYFNVSISSKKLQPDVFVGLEYNNSILPTAIIEIKLWRSSGKVENEIVQRFEDIKNHIERQFDSFPFFVFLSLHSKDSPGLNESIENFKNILGETRCLVMRKIVTNFNEIKNIYEGNYPELSINQILERIFKEIEEKISHYK